jgi:hypothetical protein
MAIVGDHPQKGIRFILERAEEPSAAAPPCVYEGAAFTPEMRYALRIVVDADGGATCDDGSVPDDLAEKARLLVRTMVRHARTEGTPPPRRIMRWRGEK